MPKIKMWSTLIVFLVLCSFKVECYNVLGIFPHFGKSHFDIFAPVMKGLAEKGHDVTVLSYFPQKSPMKNYKDYTLKLNNSALSMGDMIAFDQLPGIRMQRYLEPYILGIFGKEACEFALFSTPVQQILDSKKKFDVIIAEAFNTDCFLGLAHKLKAPIMQISSSTILTWFNPRFGQPMNPSYISSCFMGFSDKMTFLERLENTIVVGLHTMYYNLYLLPKYNSAAKKRFGKDLPSLKKIGNNVSMIMINSHWSISRPKPLSPAFIEISGVHMPKLKKLPLNIEKWINESKDGVIYFSMGSMIKGHTFPEHKKQAFLRAFGRLKQRVLWKWENDTMPGKPDNVMIQKWMPQFDILCHPNVKGFVSHGGLLGTTEAVHCGVPVVVMPQFGDQHTNARALEAGGGGIVLDFHNIEEDTVYRALKTILDPEFNKKAKQLSERFRDRPMPPLETAIYWIEYVARHKGADHMRTAAVNMPFYQYLLLDVIAFLILALAFTIFIVYHTIRITCGMCCKKTQKVKKS
ncbi:PREDICTED: UDP-glucuronosyltransferase 2B15-like isoform X2 [Nicrophorus vespilloides]|uniref:UDP-glucuronosyltransferase n=1 Tax=Nicrophorus vespilloides TaxID=110193 RepID=A0ABM1M344_NICVS|nr:PREDICTED: UDP-glucuronosyltransferase 2B15-like isoform X2 [Nicrophorus vespilloides]